MTASARVRRAVCASLDRLLVPRRPDDDPIARAAIERVALASLAPRERFTHGVALTHAYQETKTRVGGPRTA